MNYSASRLVLPGAREQKITSAQAEADARHQLLVQKHLEAQAQELAAERARIKSGDDVKVKADAQAAVIKAQLDALAAGQPGASSGTSTDPSAPAAPVPSSRWFGK